MEINKIPQEPDPKVDPERRYTMMIIDEQTGELVYQHTSRGGVLCTIEDVTTWGPTIEGEHQHIAWGNPMAQFYAADQLQKWFKKTFPKMLAEFQRRGYINSNIDLSQLFKK